jgi:hypothetical protein
MAFGIDQEIGFVRLHAYASVGLTLLANGRGRSVCLISLQSARRVNAQRRTFLGRLPFPKGHLVT